MGKGKTDEPSRETLWRYFAVRWSFLTRVCGSVPAGKSAYVWAIENQEA